MCRPESQRLLGELGRQESKKETDIARSTVSIFICIAIVVCVIIFLFIIIDLDGSGGGGGGGVMYFGGSRGRSRSSGGWGGSRGGSRGGGGGGKGGGCFDATVTVWAKNESQSDLKARRIMAKDLEEGDLVGTMDLNTSKNKARGFQWTRATDVDIFWGDWKAHLFEFASGHQLKVTSPHLMIIWNDRMWYFVRADEVQVGDVMKVRGEMTQVTRVENYVIKAKVAIETEDGTIEANEVLASGLCDNNPEAIAKVINAEQMLKEYKQGHFGEDFQTKCMDSVAWKDNYLANNGFPVQS